MWCGIFIYIHESYPQEKGMATHSSSLAWRKPRTEEPDRLQSFESHWVRHNWVINTFFHENYSAIKKEGNNVIGIYIYRLRDNHTKWSRSARETNTIQYHLYAESKRGPNKLEVKVAQSCWTLCNSTDYTVHGILKARILEWVAFPFSRGSSQPRDQTQVSHFAGRFFTHWTTREAK